MNIKKAVTILSVCVSLAGLVLISADSNLLDIITPRGAESFAALGAAADASAGRITAPDGSAAFVMGAGAQIEFDAAPFLEAGLDTSKLPKWIKQDGEKLVIGGPVSPTGTESFLKFLQTDGKKTLGYHGELDHFGVSLGHGNAFEWARDMSQNDKDMVFVLNPEAFAGADVSRIEGWILAPVQMMEAGGRIVEHQKLLKPFDVR